MSVIRYSLATLLLATSIGSVVFAGLANPNEIWERIVGTTTLLVFLAALLAAIVSKKSNKWFSLGFAIAGWSYLAIAFYGGEEGRQVLLTDYAVSALDQSLETYWVSLPNGEKVKPVRTDDGTYVLHKKNSTNWQMTVERALKTGFLKHEYNEFNFPSSEHFQDIGHYAWSLILASAGGIFCLWLSRTNH